MTVKPIIATEANDVRRSARVDFLGAGWPFGARDDSASAEAVTCSRVALTTFCLDLSDITPAMRAIRLPPIQSETA